MLVIGLTLVSIFQLAILRNPARRTLRKACANISAELTAYCLILQAYVRACRSHCPSSRLLSPWRTAVAPADGKRTVSQSAIDRVWQDLKKRETRIQGQLIGILPLLKCVRSVPPSGTH